MKMNYGKVGILREMKEGEEIPVMTIEVDNPENYDMKKIWYLMLSKQYGLERGTQKEKVVKWIIENLDSEDRVIITQRKLADSLGVSIVTVSDTMSALQKGKTPFLIRLCSGVYTINPKLAYKGTDTSKFALIYQVNKNHEDEKEEEITAKTAMEEEIFDEDDEEQTEY